MDNKRMLELAGVISEGAGGQNVGSVIAMLQQTLNQLRAMDPNTPITGYVLSPDGQVEDEHVVAIDASPDEEMGSGVLLSIHTQ